MATALDFKYIEITQETWLLLNKSEAGDERKLMPGKIYKALEEDNSFYKIRFGSKYGYIPKEYAKISYNKKTQKIMIAWDSIQCREKNKEHYNKYINKNCMEQGMDIVSPTWFTREGDANDANSIKVVERCDREYVRLAHSNGYEVWGLIADFNADRNYAVYTNEALVNNEIKDIIKYALEYDLDGINIDYEGFGSRCKKVYNTYVEKLCAELKKHNLISSIDVTREFDSDAWGKCYDRKEISKHVDYVCLMAYDENGRLDVIPGSTGSLPWVEDGITELLNMGIPKEKLILGVPFYSRDWKVAKLQPNVKSVVIVKWEGISAFSESKETSGKIAVKSGDIFNYTGETNNYYKFLINGQEGYINKNICKLLNPGEEMYKAVEVVPINMKEIQDKKGSSELIYDVYSGQDKLIYSDETGDTHFVWVEDEMSMKKRIDLVKKYDLTGAAAWMLTHEVYEIWDVVKELKR
jgi:spore germination protein YaaH